MYLFGVICITLSVLHARGDSVLEENRRLQKSNRALLQAVKALSGVETEAQIGYPETLVGGLPLTQCPSGHEMSEEFCLNIPNMDYYKDFYKTGGRADTWSGIASGCFFNTAGVVFYNKKSPDTLYDPNHVLLCQAGDDEYNRIYAKYMSANPPVKGCEQLEAKSCTGTTMDISSYTRSGKNGGEISVNDDDWCLKACEFLAINGCCQWENQKRKCYFSFDGEVVYNGLYNRQQITALGVRPIIHRYTYHNHAGMCKWSGKFDMMTIDERTSGCRDFDMGKKIYNDLTDVQCTAQCLDDPRCNFVDYKGTQCRTFTQCTIYAYSDYGFRMWQKINDEAPYEKPWEK